MAPLDARFPRGVSMTADRGGRSTVRVGCDIGQISDYTAIVVTEEERREDGLHYATRHLERLPLGTPYPEVADRIAEVMGNLRRLSNDRRDNGDTPFGIELVIDATGVGRPMIDLVRERRLRPMAVTLTGGDGVTERDGNQVSMAKSYLVARLQVLLQTGRLHLPPTSESRILAEELRDYRIAVNVSGHASFSARSGQHDDLVISLGLSLGCGTRPPPRAYYSVRRAPGRW